jgi:NAD(P)H dehydrogenase (quinone)
MNALVVFCHPDCNSYSAAVLDVVVSQLERVKAQLRVIDLYDDGFQPALTLDEWTSYERTDRATDDISHHIDALRWCDTLIFVYPTWWYGLPALLKGWLDRVMIPGVAFHMPEGNEGIKPGLGHIRRLGVYTTCGASRWLTLVVGAPGRKTIMRGFGLLCHRRVKRSFAAHYNMDSSTPESREQHLRRVKRSVSRLIET